MDLTSTLLAPTNKLFGRLIYGIDYMASPRSRLLLCVFISCVTILHSACTIDDFSSILLYRRTWIKGIYHDPGGVTKAFTVCRQLLQKSAVADNGITR